MSAVRGMAPRRVAAEVLLRVEVNGAWADAALGSRLPSDDLSAADRRLATRLVYGTLAWQRRLDRALGSWSRTPVERLDPPVRIALRLGLAQLFLSDRIPAFAAVSTSVELVAGERGGAARKLVNAVLRRAGREGEPPLPDGDSVEALGISTSHPDWLVREVLDQFGFERSRRLLLANNEGVPLVLRADDPGGLLAQLAARGVHAERTRWASSGIVLRDTPEPGFLDQPPGFLAQGEASQLVGEFAGARPGERVLDACAAPGGKASLLAQAVGEEGILVAVDRRRGGIRQARDLARRLGRTRMRTIRADAEHPPFPTECFDRILVDAPCTGTGTLRQHPEIRWRLDSRDPDRLARRQLAILDALVRVVRPGGEMTYGTCSLLRRENEGVVESFLAQHGDFEVSDPSEHLPPGVRRFVRDGVFRSAPDEEELDGFYAVRLRRRGPLHVDGG